MTRDQSAAAAARMMRAGYTPSKCRALASRAHDARTRDDWSAAAAMLEKFAPMLRARAARARRAAARGVEQIDIATMLDNIPSIGA